MTPASVNQELRYLKSFEYPDISHFLKRFFQFKIYRHREIFSIGIPFILNIGNRFPVF